MFGAGLFEPASKEEIEEFEKHTAVRLKRCVFDALWAAAAFALVVICIVPF